MDTVQTRLDRRALLKKCAALVASFAAVPFIVTSALAATRKAAKADLRYQDHPRNGKACASCWAYVAGRSATEGTCKIIEGPISADGWCMAFSPKQYRITQNGENRVRVTYPPRLTGSE